MKFLLSKIVIVLGMLWISGPLQALDAIGIGALQKYSTGVSPQIVSTADLLNEQYVVFENLMREMNAKLAGVQKTYQTWHDFIESFPSCGNGILTAGSTGANTCQNSVFPTLSNYLSGTGAATQLSFMPEISGIGVLIGKASDLLTEISNNTQKISTVMDNTTVHNLALNLNIAGLAFNNDFASMSSCYATATAKTAPRNVSGTGLNACYIANLSSASPVACSLSSNCQGEACCSTAITTLLNDYTALTQAQLAFFEEIQKYFPYEEGSMEETHFSGITATKEDPAGVGSWLLGCAVPNLCTNCGQSSGNVCDFSLPTFNFDFDLYLNAFFQWTNTMTNVTAAASNKLTTYQQELKNFISDFNGLVADIQPAATQMGTLMSCCQTVVSDYEEVLAQWDLVINIIAGAAIGIGEMKGVELIVEAMVGQVAGMNALIMVLMGAPPVGNVLVGSIVNLFSMPLAQWATSASALPTNEDRSQVLTEPQITDYGQGYSANQSA